MATKKRIEIDVWVSEDSLTFNSENQAIEYEQRRKDLRIVQALRSMKIDYNFPHGLSNWYFIRHDVELDYFKRKYGNSKPVITAAKKKLSLGDWVAVMYKEDEEDSQIEVGLITLEAMSERMKKFIEKVEENTVEGKY